MDVTWRTVSSISCRDWVGLRILVRHRVAMGLHRIDRRSRAMVANASSTSRSVRVLPFGQYRPIASCAFWRTHERQGAPYDMVWTLHHQR
jgi:hypothetical protein